MSDPASNTNNFGGEGNKSEMSFLGMIGSLFKGIWGFLGPIGTIIGIVLGIFLFKEGGPLHKYAKPLIDGAKELFSSGMELAETGVKKAKKGFDSLTESLSSDDSPETGEIKVNQANLKSFKEDVVAAGKASFDLEKCEAKIDGVATDNILGGQDVEEIAVACNVPEQKVAELIEKQQ